MVTLAKAAYNEATFMTRCDKNLGREKIPRALQRAKSQGPFDLASDRVTDRRKGRGFLLA